MPKELELNPKCFENVNKVCEAEGLTAGYIVCRCMPVLPAFVGRLDAWTYEQTEKATFYAPLLDPEQGARMFASREEAESYAERKNEERHKPFINENGHECFEIEIIEMTDYLVVPLVIARSEPSDAEDGPVKAVRDTVEDAVRGAVEDMCRGVGE